MSRGVSLRTAPSDVIEKTRRMDQGTFTSFPELAGLPVLVRRQRRLEAKIVPLAPLLEDEKACRKAIDGLLVAAGLAKSESVTCNGYDVTHNERKGQTSFDADNMVALLVRCGVDPEFVDFLVSDSTETGDPSKFATVKPSKGAKVRR